VTYIHAACSASLPYLFGVTGAGVALVSIMGVSL
jgi:hypothetical protein